MRALIIAGISAILVGCSSMGVQTQAPALDLPPIPAEHMQACDEPSPLRAGTLEEMYLAMLQDAGPWGRCVREHDKLIALVKYRDEIVARWKAQAAKLAQPGWRWPWER